MALSQTVKQIIGGVLTPTIVNISVPAANVEQLYTFPNFTQKFLIRSRLKGILKISYNSGESGITFITVPSGAFYEEEEINIESLILYFQSNQSSDTIEIISWV